jgi:two-component system, cell cycle sensor histidine kinase and response regulator CckA
VTGGLSPGERLRVLLLNHDAEDAERYVLLLRHGGYDVTSDLATNAQDFRMRLRTGSYDVVLADYGLPDLTAIDALAVVREEGLDIPLILVTARLGDERAVEYVKAGVADLVNKDNLLRLPLVIVRALDERRAREEHMRSANLIRKLSLALDQSPASVIITDASGVIEYVNRRFEHVSGYSATEAIGSNPRLLKSGETSPAVYRQLWQTIKSGQVWRSEMVNRKKSGEEYWDLVSISPIADGSGVVTHFLATQEDITERRRSEATFREREERFQQLAENIEEVFFVMDPQYRETLYISPAYERIWGRSCQSLYENPRSFMEPVAPEDQDRLLRYVATVQQGVDPGEIEFRVVHLNDQTRWVLARAVPIRNDRGDVYRISGVALDITDRRRGQEALAASEERFRSLAEASFDAIHITEGGIVREVNQGFLQMFGYSLDEVIGRPVLDFVAEESRDAVRQRLTRGIDGRFEAMGQRKDGQKLFLEATGKYHEVGGRLERVTALRDLTEKRMLEEQFRQAQKMEAVGRLAGGVAHDFNNLLTVITSYASILVRDMSESDPRHDDLEQILKASSDAASLTRQLLAFSRQQVIAPRLVILEDVVLGTRKMLRRLIGEDVELISTLSETPSPVLIDPGQLEQVIMNLAVNARDAMPHGGRLTIETSATEFDQAYAHTHWPATPGRFAMLAVSDTGVGMDEETRAKVFEPFFTTKELGKGTGLGLATVYGIVKQSGGFIWVYSEPGRGATFKIYLPLTDEVARPSGPHAEPTQPPSGTETVLLVEDAPGVRAAVRHALEGYGYLVIDAPTPGAALGIVSKRREPIHLLLTDVVMPGMSGRQLAERVIAEWPELRVLYMSGYTNDVAVRHGLLGPGLAYLQKPFAPDALAFKVREVLDAAKHDAAPGSAGPP